MVPFLITEKEDLITEIPNEFLCPISMDIMFDPIICDDGYTYDRKSILALKNLISPFTRKPIDKNKIFPNRILKDIIDKFLKDNSNNISNPLVISKPTHMYNDYLFEINQNDTETIIKIQNVNTLTIFEGILNEKNISIKPFSKFNIMMSRALAYENNYNIVFDEIINKNDIKNNVINIRILFNNDVVEIIQPFTLNEVFISDNEKQKIKIMFLENEIRNLKLNVFKLKQKNENILLMSKVISVTNEVTGKKENVVIDYKFPTNLDFFDYCEFMKEADVNVNNQNKLFLNTGNILYHNSLDVFTNLKKLKIPTISLITYNGYASSISINSQNLFTNLEELIIDVLDNSSINLNCPNLKKIVIEKLYSLNGILVNVPEYNFTIEAKQPIPNVILLNGFRMCEYHNEKLTSETCPKCDTCMKNAPIQLKTFCDNKSIKYKLIE